MNRIHLLLTVFATFLPSMAPASEPTKPAIPDPPTGNPYDVLGRVFRPFTNVLLAGGRDPEKAMALQFRIAEVTGRLPKNFAGATLRAYVQNPDKLRLDAPVFGETFTIVRNGPEVWATPGDKIEFLMNQFRLKPEPTSKPNTPLFVPISAQQAIFLVALFDMTNRTVAEIEEINGVPCRVLSGGLMPDLGRAAKAEDFRATLWIDGAYRPRQLTVERKDFTAKVDVLRAEFGATLPDSLWQPPADSTNIYRTKSDYLEAVLYVVVNSLHTDSEDKPWENER
jgi:hypothetical protein